jgi:serine protease AprX
MVPFSRTATHLKPLGVLLGIVLVCLAMGGVARAQEIPVSRLVWETLEARGKADFFVVLRDNPADSILREAQGIPRTRARRRFMVERLQRRVFQSQNDLGLWLLNQGADYRHFWIVNQVLVKQGTPGLLRQILARKDVFRIDANPRVKLSEPQEDLPAAVAPGALAAVEWNIGKIKADQVWATYGVTGAGVVVAVNDTGVKWDHEALKNQYRGWNGASADHTYSWHDAIHTSTHGSSCGVDAVAPCDDYGHGTHVAGIIAGQTLANQIGVAPGAKWIACRNMDNGFGTPATYLECLQWFLAPGGYADQAPHIINNSWSCPPSEGCAQDTLEAAVIMVRNAGIMMVVSNGNNGSSCSSTTDPPALYRASFSTGATDSADGLASFSSRGPVTYGGKTYIKPDISAPGVSIRSAYKDGGYTLMSGTSMASPHVAGVAALLWSGIPRLQGRVDFTEQLCKITARPKDYTSCGNGPGVPNNGYGYGIVDALRAYQKGLLSTMNPQLFLLLGD